MHSTDYSVKLAFAPHYCIKLGSEKTLLDKRRRKKHRCMMDTLPDNFLYGLITPRTKAQVCELTLKEYNLFLTNNQIGNDYRLHLNKVRRQHGIEVKNVCVFICLFENFSVLQV
jgi:hypothetical protein